VTFSFFINFSVLYDSLMSFHAAYRLASERLAVVVSLILIVNTH